MNDDQPSDDVKEAIVSFTLARVELAALMAWAKRHDITRARAIRSLLRIGMATGQEPDDEPDRRTSEHRAQRRRG